MPNRQTNVARPGAHRISTAKDLIQKITSDFTAITVSAGDDFRWSPSEKMVFYDTDSLGEAAFPALLLHELGHALLAHENFTTDVELIKMERAAWTRATQLAAEYEVDISDDVVELAMDDYRDWLHARSRCPKCNQNGLQAVSGEYFCVVCDTRWTANDGRRKKLRRHISSLVN